MLEQHSFLKFLQSLDTNICLNMTFESKITCTLFRTPDFKIQPQIAAFAFNGTLIAYANMDWKYMFDVTRDRLREIAKTHCIVILDSLLVEGKKVPQYTKRTGSIDITKFILEAFVADLGVPLMAVFNEQFNGFQKPCTNMWRVVIGSICSQMGVVPNLAASYYCGGLAGRDKELRNLAIDRAFAMNVRLPFFTPRNLFLGTADPSWRWRNPMIAQENIKRFITSRREAKAINLVDELPKVQCGCYLVIVTGPKCSGKSTVAAEFVKAFGAEKPSMGIKILTADTVGLKKEIRKRLDAQCSVVLDMELPNRAKRKPYIALAEELRAAVLVIEMDIPIYVCELLSMIKVQKSSLLTTYMLERKKIEEYSAISETATFDVYSTTPGRDAAYRAISYPMRLHDCPELTFHWG